MIVRKFVLEYFQAYGADHNLCDIPTNRMLMLRIPGLSRDESVYTIPDNEFALWTLEALMDIDRRVKNLEKVRPLK